MTTSISHIEEHIVVPPDRKVTIELELPPEVPEGEAVVIMRIESGNPEHGSTGADLLEFAGMFANSKTFAGDSVALIREMRDAEWR